MCKAILKRVSNSHRGGASYYYKELQLFFLKIPKLRTRHLFKQNNILQINVNKYQSSKVQQDSNSQSLGHGPTPVIHWA